MQSGASAGSGAWSGTEPTLDVSFQAAPTPAVTTGCCSRVRLVSPSSRPAPGVGTWVVETYRNDSCPHQPRFFQNTFRKPVVLAFINASSYPQSALSLPIQSVLPELQSHGRVKLFPCFMVLAGFWLK